MAVPEYDSHFFFIFLLLFPALKLQMNIFNILFKGLNLNPQTEELPAFVYLFISNIYKLLTKNISRFVII